jgi:hypothetical protein
MSETDNTNPIEDNAPLAENTTPEKKSNKKGLIVIILLLLAVIFIGYLYIGKSGEAADNADRVISLERAAHLSDSLYNELKHQLATYKQENEELYAEISRKESELESQYSKIKRLIDQAHRDKKAQKEIQVKLNNLSSEVSNMRQYVENQTLDLEELRVENRRLKKEKEALDEKYLEELAERERLSKEGADLQNANEELNKKLNTASVLLTKNVNTKGLRLKNSGEKKEVILGKRTELIETCFGIVQNQVCTEGPNRFFIRILDSSGKILLDKNRGSGKMTLFNTGKETDYTTSKIFDYNTSVTDLCIEWYAYPNTPFLTGSYRIELYNKGREVGSCNFATK